MEARRLDQTSEKSELRGRPSIVHCPSLVLSSRSLTRLSLSHRWAGADSDRPTRRAT
jgi:hypothetical protein